MLEKMTMNFFPFEKFFDERRNVMRSQVSKYGLILISLLLAWSMLSVSNSQIAQCEEFPTKQVTLVVPYGAGGAFDLAGRAMASVATDYLGQPLYILIKRGGGGAIGTEYAFKSPPDGYTLLFVGPGPNSIMPAVTGRSHGPEAFEAVAQFYSSPLIVIAHPGAPFKTFKEMVEWAKANPDKLIYGATDPWGIPDLAWKLIVKETGIKTKTVHHGGGGPAILALVGGQVQVSALLSATCIPQIKAGKAKALAVLDSKRHRELPDIPTAQESGVNVVTNLWGGAAAPKGTPRPIIDKLAVAIKKITEDKSFLRLYSKLGEEPLYRGPDEFVKFWRDEYEAHKKLGEIFKK